MDNLIHGITQLWSDCNPVAGYTSGYLQQLDKPFPKTIADVAALKIRIDKLKSRLNEISDLNIKKTAAAVLTTLNTQFDMARPSGAGPSGTGIGGIYAAADGIFYIILKGDYKNGVVREYLEEVRAVILSETDRWKGQEFSILVRKECLDTLDYLKGTLKSIYDLRPDLQRYIEKEINPILSDYRDIFYVKDLDSPDFDTYWKVFKEWDGKSGPQQTYGYPESLVNYYQLTQSENEIRTIANGWLELDLPVTVDIAERIKMLPFITNEKTLQEIWDAVSEKYEVDFSTSLMEELVNTCNAYGKEYIIASTSEDVVKFDPTPDYLVNLVTGGEDFAVNYLNKLSAYSQLYLTASKNTSKLTMINILVHEASHGFNFVLSAKNADSPLLNLNTSLEVPMTEGMAFYREYQYWAAAQNLLYKDELNDVEKQYLALYGKDRNSQIDAVLCAQFETYIWRIIRYIRTLCDVNVNGGKMTYTDFIEWAANETGLSEETLHGECFTLLAAPGYAPCYSVGGATYSMIQKKGITNGVSEIDFNTFCSKQGFYAWPVGIQLMEEYITKSNGK